MKIAMTLEQAKRILTPGNGDEGIPYGSLVAQGFIEGHAAGALQMRERAAKELETNGWNDSSTQINQKWQAFAYARVIRTLPLEKP